MAPQALAQTERLFLGSDNDDNSGRLVRLTRLGTRKSADFSSATSTHVGSEAGVVTSQAAEEEDEVEK